MRGVNKLVMEVRSDGKYFDKAILFLKPEQTNISQREISDGAEKLLQKINCQQAGRKSGILPALIGCVSGIAVTLISLILCGTISF